MNNLDICSIINQIEFVDFDRSFEYAQICSKNLRNPEMENEARKIIIYVLDNWEKIDKNTYEIWTDLIEAAGFYPYMIKEKDKLILKNLPGEIRREFHRSHHLSTKYFHEEQMLLTNILKSDKNLIVSAPTSFGKSLLIEEIVASRKYKNIVVIQPTLALLDETRKKLKKYSESYKIIVRTSQKYSIIKRNLFLLTAERVMEYPDLPLIDFFIIDEFYKLSAKRDDERSDVLNNAMNILINKHKSRFYLLGPNIDNISSGFAEKYNAFFYKTNYSLVDIKEIDVYLDHKDKFGKMGNKKLYKEQTLFKLLYDLKQEQTIIYCSSPTKARYLSKTFYLYLKENGIQKNSQQLSIIDWITKNINANWSIVQCLEYGIGVHDGALQKHITSSIIDYFNQGNLHYLFCTSTIIEGVNTSAKNVVFFDDTKGFRTEIDYFDYSNIKGRSGRMMVHYIGKIYNFNKPPQKENITIDIPFFEQNPVSDEILIQLDDEMIKNKDTEQYKVILQIPDDEKELFKKTGVLVKGQKKIVDILMKDILTKYQFIYWTGFPLYHQLEYIVFLAWDHLIKPTENVKPMTKARLVNMTFNYGIKQDITYLIEENFAYLKKKSFIESKIISDNDILDEAIRDAFQVLRHWFQYKIPKWLNVLNELQAFVCEKNNLKPGNYNVFASQIENDFIRENLSILLEYGVPKSALKILEKHIPSNLNEDQVTDYIKRYQVDNLPGLLKYEKEKLFEII